MAPHDQLPGDVPGRPRQPAPPSRITLVSVVIPMLDAADVVGDQLAALAAQDYPGGWEVVVADNGSRDGGPDIVRDWAAARLPNLRLVDAADRPGSAHARNVGTAAARGDLILYTDADDVVAPGWVSAMSRAAAGAWLLAGSDSPLRGNGRAAAPASRAPSFLPWGRGGNMGVRREAFEAVGGWDEERLRGQDVDFSWRLQLAGYPLRFVPDARAWYRRPRTLWGLARHQFEFGARAPVLYRDFRAYGARRRSPRRTLRGLAWVITRVPYLAMSDEYRRRWVRMAAGMAGRGWGTLRCWLERPKSRS